MVWRATTGFEYPRWKSVRDRLRAGEQIDPNNYQVVLVNKGQIIDPPSDLIDSWIRRKLVEEVR